MSQPFFHEELQVKQYFIELARQFHDEAMETATIDKELAAALLYMNLADYLAEYLVTGLDALAKEAMGKYYLGVVSTTHKRDRLNLERSINALKQYEFPQKPEVLVKLNAIKNARNQIAHEMLKTEAQKLGKIDVAERDLVSITEDLIRLVDEISSGLPPRNLLEKLQSEPSVVEKEAEKEVEENKRKK